MFLKITAICLIVFTATKIGFDYGSIYLKRRRFLEQLISCLLGLKGEISFKNSTFSESLINLGAINKFELFTKIGENIQNGDNIYDAFTNVKDRSCMENAFETDCIILNDFFGKIGYSDTASELNNIDYTVHLLENMFSNAKADEVKYTKLYRWVGILGGVLISLILV